MKKIKVVVTATYIYSPNLNEDAYVEAEANTIEKAMELDRKDVENGKIHIEEICSRDRGTFEYNWKVVEQDD